MSGEQRLYAVVLRMAAIRRGAIPADHHKESMSALYSLINMGDEELAQTLHDTNSQKPFTVSLIKGGKLDRQGAQHFGDGDSAEWRFTLLRDPAFAALIQRYVNNRDLPHVRIGAVEFVITDAFVSGSHPDSGYLDLAILMNRYSRPPETYDDAITLEFLTPTAFNLGTDRETRRRRFRVLPDPKTTFSALRKRWAQLGGSEPGDEFDQWVERAVELEPISLKWQPVLVEKTSIRGFVGRVRFRLWGTDRRWLPLLHLLADLAFYTGIGYQTTRGMGQVRCLNVSERQAEDEFLDTGLPPIELPQSVGILSPPLLVDVRAG